MVFCVFALLAPLGLGQSWSQAYENGLEAARAGKWADARQAFKQAAAYRTEDYSGATNLPGPATERRVWRNGAPYSPNFLAAYAAYREAGGMSGNSKTEGLQAAAVEFETLHSKGQYSPESFFFLNYIYTTLADTEKRMKLDERFTTVRNKVNFKVDTEVLAPEENAAIANMMGNAAPPTRPTPTNPNPTVPGNTVVSPNAVNPITAPSFGTRVLPLATKYALVIGNSEGKIPGAALSFSSDDAQKVREALVMSAGYPEQNVDLVLNATASQILASAKALSERIPENATVFIYFSGAGVNIDGKDYLAGVDSESATDSSSMASKADIFRLFMSKGAKVFSFFQVNRPTTAGRFFGMEVPLFGYIAQGQATMPGDNVYSVVKNGKTIGIFTEALVSTLAEFHTNQVPILEFGWQLFYRIRRGDTGSTGGSSRQTPTLPVLTNMAADAKF